jgi:hypothetical protein
MAITSIESVPAHDGESPTNAERLACLRSDIAAARRQNQRLEHANLNLRIRASHLEDRLRSPHYELADRLRRASRKIPGLRRVAEPALRLTWLVVGRTRRATTFDGPTANPCRPAEPQSSEAPPVRHAGREQPRDVGRCLSAVQLQFREISHASERMRLEHDCLKARTADLEARLCARRYRIADVLLALSVKFPWLQQAAKPVARVAWLAGRKIRQLIAP